MRSDEWKPLVVFVDADGTAEIDGGRFRLAIGNPFDPGSLYGDEPVLVPWVNSSIPRAIGEVSKLEEERDHADVAAFLKDRLRSCHDDVEISSVIPFASVNRRVFERARFKGFSGGRNSSKSASVAIYLLLRGIHEPVKYMCLRQTMVSIRESVQETLGDMIAALGLEWHYTILESEIRGANGTRFTFRGADRDPNAIKSVFNYNGVWIEEAQSIRQGPWSKIGPTLREAGSEIICTFNRESEDDPVDRHFYRDAKDRKNFILVESAYFDNPFLSYSSSRDIIADKKRDQYFYAHHWLGKPQIRKDAQVIQHWQEGDLDSEVEANPDAPMIYGLDVGGKSPHAFMEACILPPKEKGDAQRLYVCDERYEAGVMTRDLPAFMYGDSKAGLWENRNGYEGIPFAEHYAVMVDSAAWGVIAELREYGVDAQKSYKPGDSVRMGILELNNFDIYIHPKRCPNAVREAKLYRYPVDARTDKVSSNAKPIKEHDHTWDAIRYALDGWKRNLFPAQRLTQGE